ncbi:MAG: helix-turn-helix domain-containing protein [Candidatus Rokuibacteriota bacterium]
MGSLGSYLRELRQRRGLSLEELSRTTRVAPRYLEALEGDDLGALPGHVFARGFLRAYCQAMQTPPDEAIALYHRQTGTPLPSPATPGQRVESGARSRGTVLVSFVLLVVFGVALFAVANVLQSARERASARPDTPADLEPAPEAPPTDRVAVVAPAPAAEVKPGPPGPQLPNATALPLPASPPKPAETPATTGALATPYRLVARVSEATWVRVRMEEGRSTEETIPAGETREWISNSPFVLTVGNAGGIALELNGRSLPPLGARGAVISRLVIPPPQQ